MYLINCLWINKYFKILWIWFWVDIIWFSGCVGGNKLLFKIGSFNFVKDCFNEDGNVDKLMIWLVFFNGYNFFFILIIEVNWMLINLFVGIMF